MSDDLQDKLRRLGVVKGTRHLKVPPLRKEKPPVDSGQWTMDSDGSGGDNHSSFMPHHSSLEQLLPGLELVETPEGECYILDKVYPLSYPHGQDKLADLLAFSPTTAVAITNDSRFQDLDFHDFLFLDTETTGLAGAGAIAFMVGVAFFEKRTPNSDLNSQTSVLVVRQYFLRDHGDEPAMLYLLEELLADKTALVTFNGRSFDVPLLDGRYLMNRMVGQISDMPHLDLLMPSRRLWRNRLGSCALGSLEQTLLGLRRTQQDIPGMFIPRVYHQFLQTGNAHDIARVFYHNEIDMLSMVTLAARIMRQVSQPDPSDPPLDLYSLGRWQIANGQTDEGERILRWAVGGDLSLDDYHRALYELALLLKRQERREEAVPLWQQIAATSFESVDAHIELAKHYEWQIGELATAVAWTEQALKLTRNPLLQDELNHRLNRLRRKLDDA